MYTVVSIYPMPVEEFKPGQVPDIYKMPACKSDNEPNILRIKDGVDKRFVGGEFVSIDVPIMAETIAKSIVMDHRIAAPFASDIAYPGLYWLEDSPSAEQIIASMDHRQAANAQMLWFMRLVKEADDIWQKYKQHRFINEIMRIAAVRLHQEKEWSSAPEVTATIRCIACQQFISSLAVICPHCHVVIDEQRYNKLTFVNTKPAQKSA